MSVAECAEWLGVAPTTIRRQESGKVPVSPLILRLLQIRAGDLGAVHPAWFGWNIDSRGALRNDLGYKRGFQPGEINSMVFTTSHAQAMRAKIRRLERQLFLLSPANDGLHLVRLSSAEKSHDF